MDHQSNQFKAVLFDLDGTLVDSMNLHALALSAVLRERLSLDFRPEELRHLISGRPSAEMLADFTRERIDELVQAWRDYERPLLSQVPLFPGVREMLSDLVKHGVKLAVVTSQTRDEMTLWRQQIKLDGFIDLWVSSDDVEKPKPAPDSVKVAVERLGCRPEESLMVGDSSFDLLAAKAAGVPFGAACWNPDTAQLLADLQPDLTFSLPAQVVELFTDDRPGKRARR
jgi:HAD superfamily hydrolase (TIGR01509 family)